MPEEILFGLCNIHSPRHPPANYLKRLIDNINTAAHLYNNLCMTQNRQKRHYDIRAPVRKTTFDVGDLMYIRDSGIILEQSKKLLSSISPQPLHTVSESATAVHCHLQMLDEGSESEDCPVQFHDTARPSMGKNLLPLAR